MCRRTEEEVGTMDESVDQNNNIGTTWVAYYHYAEKIVKQTGEWVYAATLVHQSMLQQNICSSVGFMLKARVSDEKPLFS